MSEQTAAPCAGSCRDSKSGHYCPESLASHAAVRPVTASQMQSL